jgi:2-polyprenyl-3-methyl-5-hydroxy-6-metoxy-1,4-benzoquinol methylase
MLNLAKQTIKNLLNQYPKWICKREFQVQAFNRFNERPVEYSFVFNKISKIYPRAVLDVGTGITALPHLMRLCGCLVTAIDNIHDYWPTGMINRHYHVINDDITNTGLTTEFDLITCISVLEHIEKPDDAIQNMFSLLKPTGHLILTFPYNEQAYEPNVYELQGSAYGKGRTYITQSYSRTELERWLKENNGVIVDQEYWQFWDGDHWTVGNQILPPKRVSSDHKHQLTCLLISKL